MCSNYPDGYYGEPSPIKIDFDEIMDRLIDKEMENHYDGEFIKFADWKDILDAMLSVTAITDEYVSLNVEDLDEDNFNKIKENLKRFTQKDIDDLNSEITESEEDGQYRLHWSKL